MTERAQVDEWQVESSRITFFLSEKLPAAVPGLWTELTGEPAETSSNQPRAGSFAEDGPLGSNRLVVQGLPGRVDVFLVPQARDAEGLSTVGGLFAPQEDFDKIVVKLLDLVKASVKRVAFGLVLRLPVPSRETGYRLLAKYLHSVKLDAEKSSEFLYQINRKRRVTLGTDSYVLNRLSKWSVSILIRAQLSTVERMAGLGLGIQHATEPVCACTLELDMSTPAEQEHALPSDQVVTLLKELKQQAYEIAQSGDVQ